MRLTTLFSEQKYCRYGAFGATRCHGDTIEFGYMNTDVEARDKCPTAVFLRRRQTFLPLYGHRQRQVKIGERRLSTTPGTTWATQTCAWTHAEDSEELTISFPSFSHDSDAFENFVNEEESDEMDAYDFAPASYPGQAATFLLEQQLGVRIKCSLI